MQYNKTLKMKNLPHGKAFHFTKNFSTYIYLKNVRKSIRCSITKSEENELHFGVSFPRRIRFLPLRKRSTSFGLNHK